MEGKDFEKKKFENEDGKRHEKGQRAVQDQSMTMEKSWVMMNDRTDKEHEE